jgi:hypothetical protein
MAAEKSADASGTERVRWNDEEQGRPRARSRPRLSRTTSTDSMAIRSISRAQVDPAVTLPIHYRTV